MSRNEWRCCIAEGIGAFAIVFFGCGAISVGSAGFVGANLAFGATVAAMVFALGHLSCAHFNPAVTVAFAVVRRFPWRMVVPYVLAQCAGAVLAAAFVFQLTGESGATTTTLSMPQTVVVEAILTFFLMLVIISVATDARAAGMNAAIAIGLAVAIGGLMGGPLTGSSMNPARSLGPAVFARGEALSELWMYFVGPLIGATLGAVTYEFLRSPNKERNQAPISCC